MVVRQKSIDTDGCRAYRNGTFLHAGSFSREIDLQIDGTAVPQAVIRQYYCPWMFENMITRTQLFCKGNKVSIISESCDGI